jgi:Mn-dependent DtxR family transcriptional regulator
MLETLYLQSVILENQTMNEEHVLKLKTIQAIRKAIESPSRVASG